MHYKRGFLRVPKAKRRNEKMKMLETLAKKATVVFSERDFESAAKLTCGITMVAVIEELKIVANKPKELEKFISEKTKEAELILSEANR